MHRLQHHILYHLMRNESLRFADLKPVDIESSQFMYHLRLLMKRGWITKRDDGRYGLTPKGQRHLDGLSFNNLTARSQPRIVTLMVCQNEAGEYLFWRRKRQPHLNMVGFPYGKVHLGESVTEAARRELREKTGLTAKLTHRGDGYVIMGQRDNPTSDTLFHLFTATHVQGELLADSSRGQMFWAPASAIDDTFMPSVPDMLRLLSERPHHFFAELAYPHVS